MDHSNHPPPHRSSHPAQRLTAPRQFEWTRQSGTGPDPAVLGELARATVVEAGCGSGHNLAHLVARRGAIGIGVDHDPARISRARTG